MLASLIARAREVLAGSGKRDQSPLGGPIFFQSNPLPMWVYDIGTLRFLAVNDAAVARYGYSRDEFLVLSIAAIRPPEDVVAGVGEGRSPVAEWRHCTRSGETFPVEISAHTLDFGGRRAELVVASDITERKRAEDALRDSEAWFRAYVEQATDALFVHDVDGRLLDVNRRAWLSLGFTREQLLGMTVADVEVDFDAARARAAWQLIVPDETFTLLRHHRRRDGTTFPVEIQFGCMDLKGERYYLGQARDITARTEAERSIRHLNRVYAVLTDINQTIMRHGDPDAMLVAACRTAVDAGGFRLAWVGLVDENSRLRIRAHAGADASVLEVVERLLVADPPAGCAFTRHALETRQPGISNDLAHDRLAQPWRDAALQRRYHSMAAFPLVAGDVVVGTLNLYAGEPDFFDAQEVALLNRLAANIGFALDVAAREAARRAAEEEVSRMGAELRQAQKMEAIGHLAGGIAHDFNNLLGVMMLQVELTAETPYLPDDAREGIEHIRTAIGRGSELTRQLLLFSRRQVMQPRDLDINDTARSLGRMLERIIGEDVELALHLSPTPLIVRADAGMLEQVLLNVSVNAREAMPTGGRLTIETVETTVDDAEACMHVDAAPGTYARLRVSDTGTGIAPDVLPRIFEPFFTTKATGRGTGLGLATVFGIVRQHRGWVDVASEAGRGTTVDILLPVSDVVPGDVPTPVSTPPRDGTETILLAEDDPAMRLSTRALLERHGYRVLEAAHGMAARRVWSQHRDEIALLLTDLVMPSGLSGLELARRLRDEAPNLKVVYTSGYSAEIAGRELTLRPGEVFLQKPYPPDDLLHALRQCLDA